MNKQVYDERKAWKNAREQAKKLAIEKSIAKCYEALETVPNPVPRETFICKHEILVMSPRWHSLECVECSYLVEAPENISIKGQHEMEPNQDNREIPVETYDEWSKNEGT